MTGIHSHDLRERIAARLALGETPRQIANREMVSEQRVNAVKKLVADNGGALPKRSRPVRKGRTDPPRSRTCCTCGEPTPPRVFYCPDCVKRVEAVAARVNAGRRADSLSPVEAKGVGIRDPRR